MFFVLFVPLTSFALEPGGSKPVMRMDPALFALLMTAVVMLVLLAGLVFYFQKKIKDPNLKK